MMKPYLFLSLVAGLVFAGCANPPSSGPASPAGPPAPAAASGAEAGVPERVALDRDMAKLGLRKGMTGAEVTAALGQPAVVAPIEAEGSKAEVWTFRRDVSLGVKQVQTGMREVPYFDPFTGAESVVKEPVYSQETVTAEEEIELLMFADQLTEWKRVVRRARAFN